MIQLYSCDYVPPQIPEFIDTHITVDEDWNGKEIYIIEVSLEHPYLFLCQDIPRILKQFRIVNPKFFYEGSKPKF